MEKIRTEIQSQIFTKLCKTSLMSEELLWFTQAQGIEFQLQSL